VKCNFQTHFLQWRLLFEFRWRLCLR
jgi:hypothetical protein